MLRFNGQSIWQMSHCVLVVCWQVSSAMASRISFEFNDALICVYFSADAAVHDGR